jgi:hypothetical protein
MRGPRRREAEFCGLVGTLIVDEDGVYSLAKSTLTSSG